jgi:tRNA(Arg) A34 adenosine deaminase TadA
MEPVKLADRVIRKMFKIAAETAIQDSDDPNTRNGAVVLLRDTGDPQHHGKRRYSRAANQFITRRDGGDKTLTPSDWVDKVRDPANRDFKYAVMQHAEVGAVMQAIADHGYGANRLYLADMFALWAACPACARLIVESGIGRVHTLSNDALFGTPECPERWRAQVELGRMVLRAGRVDLVEYSDLDLGYGIPFDGRLTYV